MKYVIAVIQPDRLDEVLEETHGKGNSSGDRVERGRAWPAKGHCEVYRSHKEAGSLLRKVKLEMR